MPRQPRHRPRHERHALHVILLLPFLPLAFFVLFLLLLLIQLPLPAPWAPDARGGSWLTSPPFRELSCFQDILRNVEVGRGAICRGGC